MMRFLLDLLFPPRCILCHSFLQNSREPVCEKCARELLGRFPVFRQGTHYSLCAAPFSYEEPIRSSIHRYKFRGCSFYAKTYGAWLAACVRRELTGRFDLITWVPVGHKRRRKRGYDQAELLARELSKLLDVPALLCLKKRKDTPAQSGIVSPEDRRRNARGAYTPVLPERFENKRVLLVDDVITTGATLEECSRVLRRAGASQVNCAAMAVTN